MKQGEKIAHVTNQTGELKVNMKKKYLAAAITLAGALAIADQAAASVYAGSRLLVQDLTIVITEDGGTPVPPGPITNFDFVGTNTATLNGVSDATQTATCGGLPPALGTNDCAAASPRLDPNAANAPGSTVTRVDAVTFFGPTTTEQFANSDSEITTAQLTGDATTSTKQIAETEIQTGENASANAQLTSITTFDFDFTISGTGEVTISFEADPNLFVEIDQDAPPFAGGGANSAIAVSFALTSETLGGGISWAPQGNGAGNNSCDADFGTCVETADEEDLNRTLGTGVNPNSLRYSDNRAGSGTADMGWSNFGIEIAGLEDGLYTLTLSFLTSASVSQERVPTPGTLLLLGAGLAALGGRKVKKSLS